MKTVSVVSVLCHCMRARARAHTHRRHTHARAHTHTRCLSAISHVLYIQHCNNVHYIANLFFFSIEFEDLHDYFSWLESPLNITFSSLKKCTTFALSRNGKGTNIDPEYVEVGNRKIVTFSIPMVTEDYSNATMTVQGEIGDSICYKNFTLFSQGTS